MLWVKRNRPAGQHFEDTTSNLAVLPPEEDRAEDEAWAAFLAESGITPMTAGSAEPPVAAGPAEPPAAAPAEPPAAAGSAAQTAATIAGQKGSWLVADSQPTPPGRTPRPAAVHASGAGGRVSAIAGLAAQAAAELESPQVAAGVSTDATPSPGWLPAGKAAARPAAPTLVAQGSARETLAAFRRDAATLWGADPEQEEARAGSRRCADALLELARSGEEDLLAAHLRPDPARSDCTWTVACYQIGDFSPASLRDFPDAVPALLHLESCETPAHVAAELIAASGEGARWTAVVRSGAQMRFQVFGDRTATAESPGSLQTLRERWAEQLLRWKHDPLGDVATTPIEGPAPTPPGAGAGADPTLGLALGQVLEAVRNLERGPADQRLEQRLADLEAAQRASVVQIAYLRSELERVSRRSKKLARRLAVAEGAARIPGPKHPAIEVGGVGAEQRLVAGSSCSAGSAGELSPVDAAVAVARWAAGRLAARRETRTSHRPYGPRTGWPA